MIEEIMINEKQAKHFVNALLKDTKVSVSVLTASDIILNDGEAANKILEIQEKLETLKEVHKIIRKRVHELSS